MNTPHFDSYYCEECGLVGFKNVPGDKEGHKKWHEILVVGYKIRRSSSDFIIWEESDYWITCVTPSSNITQRKKAEKVSHAVNKALWQENFSYSYSAKESIEKDLNLFLLHQKNRIIGLVALKKRQCLEAMWDEEGLLLTGKITESPIWIIEIVWLTVSSRNKGLATRVINIIFEKLSISKDEFGWSLPFSSSGRKLAKRFHPQRLYVYHSGR